MTDKEAIAELNLLESRFSEIRKRDAAWEAVEMAKEALVERDAAVADLYHMGGCPNCTHNKGRNPHTGVYMCKKHIEFPNGDCFEWRGVKEE